ncbi:general stress protein [Plectonema cf. radiosum LEGE 06105]|uniref:General stress protein n=1 Tax=Plectonema cf. radiosum LEGE 06105 TaxID=945769 RepID=A0A8J7JTK2_9CYAN|nr:general stress protein [Plectonema radiosum]MBE9212245.1 general stress protein [Plectonema cf. radiosum LEGE 06105]
MYTNEMQRAVGTFASRPEAERALHELRDAGFNMDKISIVVKNAEGQEQVSGTDYEKSNDEQVKGGAKAGATAGGVTGGIIGLIPSLGVLAIPGVGPAAEIGIILANTLIGGGIGAASGGLLGALIGWGVPEERANYYNDQLSQGYYVVLVEGTPTEINTAESILRNQGVRDWEIYNSPMTGNVRNRAGL